MKKKLTMVAALVLVFALGVTGTLAYLTATSDTITNTFTVGKVAIELKETGVAGTAGKLAKSFKMVPGNTISKDPKVTVNVDSEACWLFVKVEKSNVLDTYISYSIADGWTELTSGVYYREVSDLTAVGATAATYSVLKNDQVTVKSSVTTEQMEALNATGAIQPTLTFTAYAAQKANLTVYQAWKQFDSSYTVPGESTT